MKNKTGRFLIVFEKVTLPDGTVKTLPSIPSSVERPAISPRNVELIMRDLEAGYKKLVENFGASSEEEFAKAVSTFLKRANESNVRVRELGTSLQRDAGISPSDLTKILERTRHVKNVVSYIAHWNKKGKKNAVKYAEAVEELANLAGGYGEAATMLSGKTKMGESTVQGWCKVAGMPDEVKRLISEEKLPSTTAFMIPAADAETQIEVAEAISGLPQAAAKKVLKYLDRHPELSSHEARLRVLG